MMRSLCNRLSQYSPSEARSVVRLLLMDTFGLTLTDICAGVLDGFTAEQKEHLERLMARLEQGEPVQYVTGKAVFCGRPFRVEQGCLIPRPETEELCQWVTEETERHAAILDIGTGSGCIAVTLKCNIPSASVVAWDVSDVALDIARENAKLNQAEVIFGQKDILCPPEDKGKWDVIVSNPPYICRREAASMERNVLGYEPHLALFVPDDDPLLFYRNIVLYAVQALKPDGKLFFEINPLYVKEMRALFEKNGFKAVSVRHDMNGKARMMSGCLSE